MKFCTDPWCAHCLQDLWMPFAHLTAWGLQNPYSSVWLCMFPSTHDHKLSSCNPRPTLPIHVHHSEQPLEACCIPGRPPEGKVPHTPHGLRLWLQTRPQWRCARCRSWHWRACRGHGSIPLHNPAETGASATESSVPQYSKAIPTSHISTGLPPDLPWVQRTDSQPLPRLPCAVPVSDCMVACFGILGVCWILWGLSDSSTMPACLAHDVCIGS